MFNGAGIRLLPVRVAHQLKDHRRHERYYRYLELWDKLENERCIPFGYGDDRAWNPKRTETENDEAVAVVKRNGGQCDRFAGVSRGLRNGKKKPGTAVIVDYIRSDSGSN